MYPKHFFERFWEGDQRNELFVCMSFHDSMDKKFELINKIATSVGFDKATRVKENKGSSVITDDIYDGIANSKFLLFDLSNDLKCEKSDKRHPNPNVMYELGIALTIREPHDIIIISSDSSNDLPFDVQAIRIHKHPSEINESLLTEELNEAVKHQEWHKGKRIASAISSLDEVGMSMMMEHGIRPKNYNHFNSYGFDYSKKIALLRLVDLGIVMFKIEKWSNGSFGYAYHWTQFGYQVMKQLGIEPMGEEEFEKSSQFSQYIKAVKDYEKRRKDSLAQK